MRAALRDSGEGKGRCCPVLQKGRIVEAWKREVCAISFKARFYAMAVCFEGRSYYCPALFMFWRRIAALPPVLPPCLPYCRPASRIFILAFLRCCPLGAFHIVGAKTRLLY
eukprot:GHVU01214150.1.p2 GENE.GHVU01214150.1~~GHVU01214150.1.p2  ORF type:complete len:111 (-),score=6.71 GHVU01214150.1:532-864(-)